MKSIYIDDQLHQSLKFIASLEKTSLSSLVEVFLSKSVEKKLSDLPSDLLEKLAMGGGSFDFLHDKSEDIYSVKDGRAIK